MFHKFIKALNNLHRGQKGITGLETAIILIAFVTVASVLAYSVLSAGIFSSERGKAAVYSGLQSAQSTMSVKGSVVGEAAGGTVRLVKFTLGLAITGEAVDMTKCVFSYWDDATPMTLLARVAVPANSVSEWSFAIVGDGAGGNVLGGTDTADIIVYLPAAAASYATFTVQINAPTGASITIQRTLGSVPSGAGPFYINLN